MSVAKKLPIRSKPNLDNCFDVRRCITWARLSNIDYYICIYR